MLKLLYSIHAHSLDGRTSFTLWNRCNSRFVNSQGYILVCTPFQKRNDQSDKTHTHLSQFKNFKFFLPTLHDGFVGMKCFYGHSFFLPLLLLLLLLLRYLISIRCEYVFKQICKPLKEIPVPYWFSLFNWNKQTNKKQVEKFEKFWVKAQ